MDSQKTSVHDPSVHPASAVAMVGNISPPPVITLTAADAGDGSSSPQISSLSADEDETVVDIPADDGFVTPSHIMVDIPADEGFVRPSHVIVDIPDQGLPSSSHVIVDIPAEITHALASTTAGVQNVDPITPSSRNVPVISDDESESRHSSDLPRDISAAIAAGPPNPPQLPDYVCVSSYIHIYFFLFFFFLNLSSTYS